MVLTVIITVIILVFVVSGYWLNSNFEVERQGLLQISSFPTGASVEIDGESSWLQRTNTSKVLPSGEQTVNLSKDGYDTWSKTINISEGLLYRIHYPRLFLKERTPEGVLDVAGVTMATISPDYNTILLANATTEWQVINLDSETISPQKIDISSLFSGTSIVEGAEVGVFGGKIISVEWSLDNTHILFKTDTENGVEWVLLNIDNLKNSINLSKEFGINFESVEILDNSANNLLVLQNGNLQKIDIPSKSISSIIANNVNYFDYFNNEIAFSALDDNGFDYYVGFMKLNDKKITKVKTLTKPAKVAMGKFYDDKYIVLLLDNLVSLYRGEGYLDVTDFELSFIPERLLVGHHGEFVTMSTGAEIATLEMESGKIIEWSTENENYNWLDDDMIYVVSDGKLIVYDFDGYNRRTLAKNVSSYFPVTITNNKWLYYFSDNKLTRELLIPR